MTPRQPSRPSTSLQGWLSRQGGQAWQWTWWLSARLQSMCPCWGHLHRRLAALLQFISVRSGLANLEMWSCTTAILCFGDLVLQS